MKFLPFIIIMVMCAGHSTSAWCQNDVDTVIVTPTTKPIIDNSGNVHRAPILCAIAPTIFLDNVFGVLKFVVDEECAPISYDILDKDSVVVLSGTLLFDEHYQCSVYLSLLAAGNYTIQMQIGNVIYSGMFYKKDEKESENKNLSM